MGVMHPILTDSTMVRNQMEAIHWPNLPLVQWLPWLLHETGASIRYGNFTGQWRGTDRGPGLEAGQGAG